MQSLVLCSMDDNDLIGIVIGEALHVHKKVGPGMLESVYQTCLIHRLRQKGFSVENEKPIPVVFEGIQMECGYRADIVVENKIVIDVKNVEAIAPIHIAQVLTYLRFLNLKHGLILNFKTVLLKDGIKRVINGY